MLRKFPCGLCRNSVKSNQRGLLCTQCKSWIHISCARVPVQLYDNDTEVFLDWECPQCMMQHLPFYGESANVINVQYNSKKKLDEHIVNQPGLKYNQLSVNGLKCLQLNVVSLLKHFDEIKSILCSNDIHLFALNETRLDDSVYDTEISIPQYSVIRNDRKRKGGGVAIYVHNSLNFHQLTFDSTLHLEALIDLKKKKKTFIFVTWYRPSSSKCDILNYYETMLTFLEGFNKPIILMGDITFDILKQPQTSGCKRYNQLNAIHGLKHVNKSEYTRITKETSTLVDHIITNCTENVNSFGVIHNGLSDHSMTFLIWNTRQYDKCSDPNFVTFRKSKGVDLNAFKREINELEWSDVKEMKSIDDAVDGWQELLLGVVNRYMPLKTKRLRKKHLPWLNEWIFELMKKRDKMKEKAKIDNKDVYWKEYRQLTNKVTFENRKLKRKYFIEKLTETIDRNQTWPTLKADILSK